jgi:tetratricopeptide (TPR) repeat protein
MALIRMAGALADGGKTVEAVKVANEAGAIFERLRAGGDKGEATSLGLALSRFTRTTAGWSRRSQADLEEAAALLRPFVASGTASRATKLALADLLQFLSLEIGPDQGIPRCEESRAILAGMGALTLSDLTASSIYADVCDTESRLALSRGKLDEAQGLARTVADLAEKVLARRPGDLRAMRDRFEAPDVLGRVAHSRDDYAGEIVFQRQAMEASRYYTLFNPADGYGWLNWSEASNRIGMALLDEGRVTDAVQQWRTTTEMEKDPRNTTGSYGNIYFAWQHIAITESQRGRVDEAEKALGELHRLAERFKKTEGTDQAFNDVAAVWESLYRLDLLATKGNYQGIHDQAAVLDQRLQKIAPKNALTRDLRNQAIGQDHAWMIEAALHTGRREEALAAAQALVAHPPTNPTDEKFTVDMLDARDRTRLGQALLEAGHRTEAQAQLTEAIAYYRSRQAKGAQSTSFRQDFGRALYQEALVQDADEAGQARRRALLDEALSVLSGISPEAQQFRTSRELIKSVTEARTSPGQ